MSVTRHTPPLTLARIAYTATFAASLPPTAIDHVTLDALDKLCVRRKPRPALQRDSPIAE